MLRCVLVVVALSGCYRPAERACSIRCSSNGECPAHDCIAGTCGSCAPVDSREPVDVPPDVSIDAPNPNYCQIFGTGLVRVMGCPMPGSIATIPAAAFSTDGLCTAIGGVMTTELISGVGVCAVFASTITVGSGARPTGSLPLVLAATDLISVLGEIDIGSHPGSPGAGAGCKLTSSMGSSPGGGGPGGTYRGMGGLGAASSSTGSTDTSASSPFGATMGGGCDGDPGDGYTLNSLGDGGRGGGAIALISNTMLDLASNASVLAGGAQGNGGNALGAKGGGGGGGGAGGLIVLDSPMLSSGGARLCANGGAGGGGASPGIDGSSGADGCANGDAAAGGGGGQGGGGNGGDGSSQGTLAGTDAMRGASGDGGGGGGGGAGYIYIYGAPMTNITSSPPAL